MGKREMRKAFTERVGKMGADERTRLDRVIRRELAALDVMRDARTVGVYSPLKLEPDIAPFVDALVAAGKNVAYPVITGEHTMEYALLAHGADQPWVANPLAGGRGHGWAGIIPEAVLVPGIAFDRDGYRLGHGGGFYDTWLSGHDRVETIGVCYPCQLADTLPREGHDIPMHTVVCGSGVAGAPK